MSENILTITPKQLESVLEFAIANKINTLIVGTPGCGKTDIVRATTKRMGADLIVDHPALADPTDPKGLPFLLKNGEFPEAGFAPYGTLLRAIKAVDPTVFFMDDFGQAELSVQKAYMQLLQRQIGDHIKISNEVVFIAATNRREDKAGVQGILEPIKSRFGIIVHVKTDLESFTQWAIDNDMPPSLIGFIRFKPTYLDGFAPSKEIENHSCPRSIAAVGRAQNSGVPRELETIVFTGAAGTAFAVDYLDFLQIHRTLPDPDEVIRNPRTTPVPKDPRAMYGICAALSYRATPANADAIMTYANRIPVEYAVYLIADSLRKNKSMAETKSFSAWLAKNKDMLLG